MPSKFYQVIPFPYEKHWLLQMMGEDELLQSIPLIGGEFIRQPPSRFHLRVTEQGHPMDFSLTPFGVPVLSSRAAAIFEEVALQDVQLIPASIQGVEGDFCVLNVMKRLACVDEARSKLISIAGPSGGSIVAREYVLDPALVGDCHIFRLHVEPLVIVITDQLKNKLESRGLIGPGVRPTRTVVL